MRITFEVSGGLAYFPARSRPIVIDTAQIHPQVAAQLKSLVQESHFFEQPAHNDTTAEGAADYQTYTITVHEDMRAHIMQLTDPINDANLERLVSHLQDIAHSSMS